MKNLSVQLRIYKGREAYDAKGNLISDNQTLKLKHNTLEWRNFMKSIKHLGISKVEVVQCLDGNEIIKDGAGITHPKIDTPEKVLNEVKNCLAPEVEKLTPEQQKIADLEKTINEMKALISVPAKASQSNKEATTPINGVEKEVPVSNGVDIEVLKKEYFNITEEKSGKGKKPHHLWKADRLTEEIAKLQSN